MSKWSRGTIYLSVSMIAIGFVIMTVAWWGAAGFDNPEQQFPYLLSGSIPGLGLVMAGLTLAVVQELRRLTALLLGALSRRAVTDSAPAGTAAPSAVPADGSQVVAGGTAYHSPDCKLVEGRRDLQPMAAEEAARRGLLPCRICEPDSADEAA